MSGPVYLDGGPHDRGPLDGSHFDGEVGDAHGRAALLLVESLIHALTERSILTLPEAVEVMDVALAAQEAISEDAPRRSASMQRASALLASLAASLRSEAGA